MLPVKQDRPALFDALAAIPWATTAIGHESTEAGHGRTEANRDMTRPFTILGLTG